MLRGLGGALPGLCTVGSENGMWEVGLGDWVVGGVGVVFCGGRVYTGVLKLEGWSSACRMDGGRLHGGCLGG